MKRTKNINHAAFRKAIIVGGVAIALTGCEVADETVKMYQTVDQCSTAESSAIEQCKASFEQAKTEHEKAGPKFESASDCAEEFGTCEYNLGSSSFMPLMAGFMMGQMMGNMQANSNFRAAQPMYKNSSGDYYDKDRRNYGSSVIPGKSFKTTKSSLKPATSVSKPQAYTPPKQATSSRGGFGKSVSSRSSFGG